MSDNGKDEEKKEIESLSSQLGSKKESTIGEVAPVAKSLDIVQKDDVLDRKVTEIEEPHLSTEKAKEQEATPEFKI